MLKRLSILLLALFSAFLCASTVFAWDDLIRFSAGSILNEQGNMYGMAAVRYVSTSKMYDQNGDKQDLVDTGTELRIPIRVNYAIKNNLQAFAILPIVSQNKYLTPDGKDNSGIGDIWLGGKYAVMPEGLLTLRGALDIPTGDDKKGLGNAGGFGIDVAALTGKKMDKLSISGGLGIRYNAEDSDTKWQPGLGFYLDGYASYAVTEKIPANVYVSYMNYGDGKADGTKISDSTVNWLSIAVLTGYKINEDFTSYIWIDSKLMGTNTPADLGIGIGIGHHCLKK